jgi:phage tail-like protein
MPTEELFGAYNFLLEISGVTANSKTIIGGFKSVSGMDSETEVIEFKQGNDHVIRKKPGRTTYANIVLERGYTATDDLWKWRKNIEDGIIDRRSGTITSTWIRTCPPSWRSTTSTRRGPQVVRPRPGFDHLRDGDREGRARRGEGRARDALI